MAKKTTRKQRKTMIIAVMALVILGIAVLLSAAVIDRSGAIAREKTLLIREGMTYEQLLDSLTAEPRVLKRPGLFGIYARLMKFGDEDIRPGRYLLKPGMTTRRVINMVRGGLQTAVNVTFNNIRVMPQLAGRLGGQLDADSLAFLGMLTSAEVAKSYGFDRQTFIAMFIPNTYQIYWFESPEDVAGRMHREYEKFWNQERLSKLRRTGLSQIEVSILASIVYEETKKTDEMPTVAGVYINRLRIGMKLQADPTVKFAIGDFAIKRLYNRHLEHDSPYNTYLNAGLPPGPVCMPSIAAIDAVLNFEEHDYIYFCASPDFSGYHRFTKDYNAHLRNRDEFTRALTAAGIR